MTTAQEVDLGSFQAVRSLVLGKAITVAIADEVFTISSEPSLGDTFDLMDAPEPAAPEGTAQAVRALSTFLERVIVPEERARYQALLYRLPRTQGAVILMDAANRVLVALTGFPTVPLGSSSGGQRSTGVDAKRATAGSKGSSKRPRAARTRSSTG